MQVTLEQLLTLPELQSAVVAAGAKGLRRKVHWIAAAESVEFKSFVRENELVFTTGVGTQGDGGALLSIVQSMDEVRAAGIVVNLGPYIESIPQSVIDYADARSFPVLSIPWEARIADITHAICEHIMRVKGPEQSVAELMRQAVEGRELKQADASFLSRNGVDLMNEYTVLALSIEGMSEPQKQSVCATVQAVLSSALCSAVYFAEKDCVVFALPLREGDIAAQVKELLLRLLDDLRSEAVHIRAGLSECRRPFYALHDCYQQAMKAYKIAQLQSGEPIVVLHYGKLGVYRLLDEAFDKEMLKRYYEAVLGPLESVDKLSETGYLDFLKIYMEEDGSTSKISQRLFMHRNSVLYKINKIEEILGGKLSSLQVISEISLSLAIRNLL